MDLKKIDLELQVLVKQARLDIWEICTRINWLHNNSRAYASECGFTAIQAADRLESYLADFAVNMQEVATILSVFPNKEQWNRPLLQLRDAAFDAIASRDREEKQSSRLQSAARTRGKKTTRNVEMDEAKAKIGNYAELLSRRDEEIDQLNQRIQQLQADKESLLAKVKTLEKKLRDMKKQLAPA